MALIASNGTSYELHGPENAPVIVLIHGLGLCRHLWDDHLPEFTQNYRVLNYDLFGHGDSAPSPETASLKVYSEQLLDLLDELSINRAAVVGFSIGGMINRRFALDHGDRLSALCILNSPHERGEGAQTQVEQRAAQVIHEGPMATMDAALIRWFTSNFRDENLEKTKLVREWREQADKTTYPDACMVLAGGVKELIRPINPITVPTLIMTCENDSGSTPAMTHAISSEIENAKVQILPHLQHLGLMEKPEQFTKPVIEFLNDILKQ